MQNKLTQKDIKEFVKKKMPMVGRLKELMYSFFSQPKPFPGSKEYWEARYAAGQNSGDGSYGKLADFKAEIVNKFVIEKKLESVIEFGCGDGNQLKLSKYPNYIGFDVSETAVNKCKQLFAGDNSKEFGRMCDYAGQKADLVLSLDVIYHLVEDSVFNEYMRTLFVASNKYVVIYSSDFDDGQDSKAGHVRNRKFSYWIQQNLPGWKLLKHIPNRYTGESWSEFFIYEKIS